MCNSKSDDDYKEMKLFVEVFLLVSPGVRGCCAVLCCVISAGKDQQS